MNNNKLEELKLNDDIKVNKDGKPILGTLEGPCADFIDSTRNGRMYDEDLWEKVFNDPIIKEQLEAGGIPGELDHPADRTETDSSKIAIMMPEAPKKGKDGKLMARFDILDTPNGRIAYTLAKYGYKLGISSRGSGETYRGLDGKEHVDKDTYDFVGFDLVLIPAVKAARLNLISESLETQQPSKLVLDEGVKVALTEALNNASEDDRKIMNETLQNLNLDITTRDSVDIDIDSAKETTTADNDGEGVFEELKKLLKENRDLSKQVKYLQEQLSVCYTKEESYVDTTHDLSGKVKSLNETLSMNQKQIGNLSEQITLKDSQINELRNSQDKSNETIQKMTESISSKDAQINEMSNQIKSLNEELAKAQNEKETELKSLKENLRELTKDSAIKKSEYTTKLTESMELNKKYKSIAQTAVDRYIKVQAVMLGVTSEDIRSKLSESYSFSDIDRVCESLKNYNLNVNSLPFDASKKAVRMQVTEKAEPKSFAQNRVDDEPDAQLLGMARIKN